MRSIKMSTESNPREEFELIPVEDVIILPSGEELELCEE